MVNYIYDIKMAVLFFPFIALIITVPFILINYHKYGSVYYFKTIITYSFVLYMVCAYFLIIFPLPDRETVLNLTTKRIQLFPLDFIRVIIKNFKPAVSFLTSSYIYVPIFNVLLTLPFGVYLRYYFKCNMKKTILYTFLLSLFFELTQLSGLYGIYPRGYRLCDVDDLIQNTCGGLLGYAFAGILMKFLPSEKKIREKAMKKGTHVTGFKRFTSATLDMMIISGISLILAIFIHTKYLFEIVTAIYLLLTTVMLKGSTLAQKWLNLKVVDYNKNINIFRTLFRYFMFFAIYYIIPAVILKGLDILKTDSNKIIINIIMAIIIIPVTILDFTAFIKYTFTKKQMAYEKISKTNLISTIKYVDENVEKDNIQENIQVDGK